MTAVLALLCLLSLAPSTITFDLRYHFGTPEAALVTRRDRVAPKLVQQWDKKRLVLLGATKIQKQPTKAMIGNQLSLSDVWQERMRCVAYTIHGAKRVNGYFTLKARDLELWLASLN